MPNMTTAITAAITATGRLMESSIRFMALGA
jgi:hypothetical protein